jgi:Lrp/AsnC family transcriptional regulator for asnA, asnC and gidA
MTKDEDISLDELDLKILYHLEKDGRKSYAEIARDAGVSIGTVHNRVTRMIANKTLTIIGRINPFHAGLHAFALILIAVKPPQLIDDALQILSQYPEVSFMGIVTGDYDIHIDVMCRDNDHLYEIIHDRISKIPGVMDIKTIQVLRVNRWMQPSLQLVKDHHLNDDHH